MGGALPAWVAECELKMERDKAAPGLWVASVIYHGRAIDGGYFKTKAAARRWFAEGYRPEASA